MLRERCVLHKSRSVSGIFTQYYLSPQSRSELKVTHKGQWIALKMNVELCFFYVESICQFDELPCFHLINLSALQCDTLIE